MKKIAAFFAYLTIAIFFVIFFLPKINLYYKAEEFLKSQSVVIAQEGIHDNGLRFSLSDAKLYYGDLYVAEFSEISITTLLVYNNLSIEAFTLSSEMKQFLPREIEEISVTQSIFDPLHVNINASGEFGDLNGSINLSTHLMAIDINASSLLQKQKPFWLRKLKKTKGGYHYERSY